MSRSARKSEEGLQIIEEQVKKSNGERAIRRYSKGNFLGKGGFARVYEMTDLETNKVTAGKIVSKEGLGKSRAKQKLMSEIKIHRSLHHPNIVGFEHVFEDSDNVYILLEMCSNQTMAELLRRRKRLTELEVQCYMLQLLGAVKYLHAHSIIHRDLKLGNLFLTDQMQIKIGDFGLAAKVEYPGERKRTVCGTPNYIAPEVLEGKSGHSYEADVWSIGVIAYTLLVGKPPFETSDVKSTYRRIRMNAYSFPENIPVSEAGKNLISRILMLDPEMRPTVEETLAHEFFHQGTAIPKLLPTSTIACPPSASYLRQFGASVQPSKSPLRMTESQPTLTRATMRFGSTRDLHNTERISRPPTEGVSKKSLAKQSPLLPKDGSDVWVEKWVDYSSKYGLGYVLSNGSFGVFFNDSTKIIQATSGNRFNYMTRQVGESQDLISRHSLDNFPKELRKKVTLLQHFKGYLKPDQIDLSGESDDLKPIIYVKKWNITRHAIMFRLTNKVVQVIFQDKTEVLLSTETHMVTYVDKKGLRSTIPIEQASETSNSQAAKRIKYTKDMLSHMTSEGGTGSTRP